MVSGKLDVEGIEGATVEGEEEVDGTTSHAEDEGRLEPETNVKVDDPATEELVALSTSFDVGSEAGVEVDNRQPSGT